MKTTVEISDALLAAAKRRATEADTTLRELIEQGLRSVLATPTDARAFSLRDESVAGRGLHPDIRDGGWDRVVELTYEGHGG